MSTFKHFVASSFFISVDQCSLFRLIRVVRDIRGSDSAALRSHKRDAYATTFSMVEQKLFRVDQGPDQVLEAFSGRLLRIGWLAVRGDVHLGHVIHRGLHFLRAWRSREG